jgi:hypothetical protein
VGIRIIAIVFLLGASVTAAHAAWEKVPMPRVEEPIIKMEFANTGLGYALVRDPYSGHNFFRYMNGGWALGGLPGMFLGCPSNISLLPSGYGWVTGIHGGANRQWYTGRSWGGGVWEYVSNPYEQGPFSGTGSPSVAAVEDVWFLYSAINGFIHYQDGLWEELGNVFPSELGSALSVDFVNENDGWVSGENGFAHYENGSWRFVPGPGGCTGIQFTAPDDGWASNYDAGTVYHFNGSSWSRSFTLSGYKVFWASFYDRSNGWADFYKSGAKPAHRIFKYESGTWREVKPPDEYGVWMPCSASPTDAWFLGRVDGLDSYTSWHWYTEPAVKPASLGRIKAIFK